VDQREVEWQFDALDLGPVERWLHDPAAWGDGSVPVRVEPAGSVNQVDQYLDTVDWRFHRAGYVLRIRRLSRRKGAAGEATLKSLDSTESTDPALRNRRELTERLEQPDPASLVRAEGPVGERVRAVAGRRRLRPLFEVSTRRRLFSVEVDGFSPGGIGLDETAIRSAAATRPGRLRRVELELPEESVPALESFVEGLRTDCGLQPAGLSKYEAGLLSAGLRPKPLPAYGSTEIDPELAIGAVAVAVLRRHFSALLAKEPGTRLGDDIEELHDMRVASRRLRAGLSLFREVLSPEAEEFREELRWLGAALGAVRDLDVQLEQLDGWLADVPEPDRDALSSLRSLLEDQRAPARAALLEALDSRRYEAFVSGFGRMLRARQRRDATPPARAAAPDLIEARFRKLRKAAERIGPDSGPADYHKVRIRGKRFRYALEFLADVYPGKTRSLTKQLEALQDVLGLHQDAEVAIDRLRSLAVEGVDGLGRPTIFAMGEIAERYRHSMMELREQFPRAYARVSGKRWKSLRKVLEGQRPAEPDPAASEASAAEEGGPPPEI
jgi:CHAD domain-containing protein